MSKRTREINARYEKTRAEVRELARQRAAEKMRAGDDPAKAERLTREHDRPLVWFNR
jgi:hypothetical protein